MKYLLTTLSFSQSYSILQEDDDDDGSSYCHACKEKKARRCCCYMEEVILNSILFYTITSLENKHHLPSDLLLPSSSSLD